MESGLNFNAVWNMTDLVGDYTVLTYHRRNNAVLPYATNVFSGREANPSFREMYRRTIFDLGYKDKSQATRIHRAIIALLRNGATPEDLDSLESRVEGSGSSVRDMNLVFEAGQENIESLD